MVTVLLKYISIYITSMLSLDLASVKILASHWMHKLHYIICINQMQYWYQIIPKFDLIFRLSINLK